MLLKYHFIILWKYIFTKVFYILFLFILGLQILECISYVKHISGQTTQMSSVSSHMWLDCYGKHTAKKPSVTQRLVCKRSVWEIVQVSDAIKCTVAPGSAILPAAEMPAVPIFRNASWEPSLTSFPPCLYEVLYSFYVHEQISLNFWKL